MCNYKYKLGKIDRTCDAYKILDDAARVYDDKGDCIFHSEDVDWKRRHNFHEYLQRYIDKNLEQNRTPNFDEFIFCSKSDSTPFVPDDTLFYGSLRGAQFRSPIHVSHKTFEVKNTSASLANAHFHSDVIFQHCHFLGNVDFSYLTMSHGTFELCEDTVIEGFVELNGTKFKEGASLVIRDTEIRQQCYLQKLEFHELGVFTLQAIFHDYFLLEGGVYNCSQIDFTDSEFRKETVFRNVNFDQQTFFNNILVHESMLFTGSGSQRVFNAYTEFDINTENFTQNGRITFQNVNISHIIEEHRIHLEDLEKLNRIVIGPGCIKYRLQTQVITIAIDQFSQFIIDEMTRSFVNFFINSSGKKLGVDIVDRDEKSISLIYFSDENMSSQEFESMLQSARAEFVSVFGKLLNGENSMPQMELIKNVNGAIDLFSIFLKTSMLDSLDLWKKQNSAALVNSISPVPEDQDDIQLVESIHNAIKNQPTIQSVLGTNPLYLINPNITHQTGKVNVHIQKQEGDVHMGDHGDV